MWLKIRRILIPAVLALCACDSEPSLGKYGHEPEVVSVAYLRSLYPGVPKTIRSEISIEGRIVANDRWGNFYKTLVIQDETGGIEVKLDASNLHETYACGEMVRINCNGLTVGAYGGSVQLGTVSADPAYETGYIPENRISSVVVLENGQSGEPLTVDLTIARISDPQFNAVRYVNCDVRVSGVQFVESGEATLVWAGADSEEKTLIDGNGNTLVVRTSRFASFAEDILPSGSGTVRGIFGWFNGTPQLKVYDPRKVYMEDARF